MGTVDSHVGKMIRARRNEIGKTQHRLAKEVGLTYQQIQKYEHGQSRVAAPYLWAISNALGVRVDYFFEGLDGTDHDDGLDHSTSLDDVPAIGSQALRLVRHFRGLKASQKNAILELVVSMSGENEATMTDGELD